MKKVWFITGASRGLGRQLVQKALASGDCVAACARNAQTLSDLHQQYPEYLLPIAFDVTHYDKIASVIASVVGAFGRIDYLVNNAGFGITGAAEAFSEGQVRSQLETNLYAPIAITRAVLPVMRQQRSGHIVQISSIGGRVGTAGVSVYQSAKFGLAGFSEALSNEVAGFGIRVTSVEPGGFRTDWAGESMTFAPDIDGYDLVNNRRAFFESGAFVPMGDPEKAAEAILSIAGNPEAPVHLVLGSDAVNLLKSADERRKQEFEKWLHVSLSTDADGALNFLETEQGKAYLGK